LLFQLLQKNQLRLHHQFLQEFDFLVLCKYYQLLLPNLQFLLMGLVLLRLNQLYLQNLQ
jgi:hypothetical protein